MKSSNVRNGAIYLIYNRIFGFRTFWKIQLRNTKLGMNPTSYLIHFKKDF